METKFIKETLKSLQTMLKDQMGELVAAFEMASKYKIIIFKSKNQIQKCS